MNLVQFKFIQHPSHTNEHFHLVSFKQQSDEHKGITEYSIVIIMIRAGSIGIIIEERDNIVVSIIVISNTVVVGIAPKAINRIVVIIAFSFVVNAIRALRTRQGSSEKSSHRCAGTCVRVWKKVQRVAQGLQSGMRSLWKAGCARGMAIASASASLACVAGVSGDMSIPSPAEQLKLERHEPDQHPTFITNLASLHELPSHLAGPRTA
jgi:hypothetical protein